MILQYMTEKLSVYTVCVSMGALPLLAIPPTAPLVFVLVFPLISALCSCIKPGAISLLTCPGPLLVVVSVDLCFPDGLCVLRNHDLPVKLLLKL